MGYILFAKNGRVPRGDGHIPPDIPHLKRPLEGLHYLLNDLRHSPSPLKQSGNQTDIGDTAL